MESIAGNSQKKDLVNRWVLSVEEKGRGGECSQDKFLATLMVTDKEVPVH